MSFEEFKSIVDQFPRLQWIGLTGIGASLLNRDFMRMLRYLRSNSKAIIIELYDSFYVLNGDIARELIELQIDHIYASVDGATKETYESIRMGAKFEDVIDNVRRFVDLKRSMGAYFPELSLHYIIGRHNIHELTVFVELAHSLGVNHVFFTALLHSFDEIRDLLVTDKKELEQRIHDAQMKGEELGIHVNYNLNKLEHRPPIRQCNAWIQPFIFSDGTVISCCAQNESNRRDFQKEHSFGNVFEDSFRDIWFGEKYVKFRHAIRRGEVPTVCRDCPVYDARAN